MASIAIVYFSGSGHTHLLAEAAAKGARSVAGTSVTTHRITGEHIKEGRWSDEATLNALQKADAIIFGAPTYMGGPASQFKAFADATGGIWMKRTWKDKFAAGFTHSGSPSGDKLNTLQYFVTLAAQHGMIWINAGELPSTYAGKTDGLNRLGAYIGVMGQTLPDWNRKEPLVDSGDILTAETLGARVATLATR